MNHALPEHLHERLRLDSRKPFHAAGRFVLYWMHNALRAHENPALDVALVLAEQLGLPLFVYQGLSERYRFANDRHHAFILQGARDAHAELSSRGIGSAFHLERRGHRGPHLRTLATQASVIITEDFPCDPIPHWIDRLTAAVPTPIGRVDTACVVPMKLVGKAHDRAFAFRDAIRHELEKRLNRPWQERPNPASRFVPSNLPFEPIDLAAADLGSLMAECNIDHSVGPVPHTQGGSKGGYERWNAFKSQRLQCYADNRNDALRDGVSRMSAYLHYGMVSPMRLAREAASMRGRGAEKYLDELIIWRELAYAFCQYRSDHESLSAIPKWAQQTLRDRERDPRPALLDWETLARAQTGDSLWDAAQLSLLMQGELHNNVRMTWGKAFLNWTENATEALRLMIDLNHRYALDGRDPASYGGLLWCLGQFDRAHSPPQRIFGTVRTRPTEEHAARLDPERFRAHTARTWRDPMPRVAVIGAGMAGLICARTLVDHGFPVTVFDKGRGPGGRTASRTSDEAFPFDHGAQYFTARDPNFRRYAEAWQKQGIIAPWQGRIVKLERGEVTETGTQLRYVGVPGMTAMAAHLARDLTLQQGIRITRVSRQASHWQLLDERNGEFGPFEFLVVALPPPQAAAILEPHELAKQPGEMSPCWAVMLAFEDRLEVPYDGAFVHQSSLSWIARNSSKPGRSSAADCWVLHASPEWSKANLEASAETVLPAIVDAFATATQCALPGISYQKAHRWRYSLGSESDERQSLYDRATGLVACGDWYAGGRVEGAFLSGASAAGHLLREVGMSFACSTMPDVSPLTK